MPAYLIVDCEVTDPARYENYKKLTPAAIAAHGGRFLVRGGATAVLEGEWQPKRVVVVEFPTLAAARAFYDSPEYRKACVEREGAAKMNIIAAEGV
jgi:uncharacterized protein (DUF1330 family)